MSSREHWADYARGIGIVLVVYGHVARGVHSAGLPDPSWYGTADSVIYSFHMPLFFFLSGLYFLASLERHGTLGLLAGKLRTVAWPYLVWSVLQGLVEVLLSRMTNGSVTLAEVASMLWQPRAQFWFLYALFFLSLVSLPIFRWLPARGFPVVLAASCLAYLISAHLPGGIPLHFLIEYSPYFTFGILFGRVATEPAQRWGATLPALALAAGMAYQWLFHGPLGLTYATGPRPLTLTLAAVSILAIVLPCIWLQRFRLEWLAALGRASLAIYVMHILAGSGVRIVLHKLLGIDSVLIHLAVGTLLGIGLPVLALRLMKRFRLTFLLIWPQSSR
jgi:fucose 4-O-acetylase-like acetyltransferase